MTHHLMFRAALVGVVTSVAALAAGCTPPYPQAVVSVPGTATIVFPLPKVEGTGVLLFNSSLTVCVDTNTAVRVSWTPGDAPDDAHLVFNGVSVGGVNSSSGPFVTQPFGPGCGTFFYGAARATSEFGPNIVVTFEKA